MANLFSLQDVRNHPRRSGFDMSNKVAFTAKAGELLPVYWKLTLPDDTWTLGQEHFTRTQPVNTAAYTRVREYFDWFWVPLSVLWKSAPSAITQMTKNPLSAQSFTQSRPVTTDLPTMNNALLGTAVNNMSGKLNAFGFDRADLAHKLIHYLNFGNVVTPTAPRIYSTSITESATYSQRYLDSIQMNIFPLLAYQKFYQDYFRYSQWEDATPFAWNVDYSNGGLLSLPSGGDSYWNNPNMFDLRFANWNKDLFMGVLPATQYGDVASISTEFTVPNSPISFVDGQTVRTAQQTSSSVPAGTGVRPDTTTAVSAGTALYSTGFTANPTFDILALRQAEALQRWKEITISGSQDYRSQMKKHFGVDLPYNMSNLSLFIEGQASNLDISEVVNQDLTTADAEATIHGKGVGTGQGYTKFSCKEHGILMCIYHCVPLLEYTKTGPDGQLLATTATDLPIPEFDSIGFEKVPLSQLSNSRVLGNETLSAYSFGYSPRYYAYKTSVDLVRGAFTTTLLDWVAPINDAYAKMLIQITDPLSVSPTYNWFKVNPSILDPIFAVKANSKWDTDQFLVNAYFDCKVARNLDYNGLPY